MGDELYGNKKLGLRELLQNSIDACILKKEILDKGREFGDQEFKPVISIILDENKNQVIIKDNGIGMNLYVLKNYFLRLGSSYYNSDDFNLKGYSYKPIGNYGIGFLASFMLTDEVKVKTRHMNDSKLYEVELNKYDEFVCINHVTEHVDQGTEVILKYDQFIEVWKDSETVLKFLREYFLTNEVSINYVNKKNEELISIENSLFINNEKINIELNKYLDDIDGQVILSQEINNIFTTSIKDIRFVGEPLVYDGDKLISLDDSDYELLDFLNDDSFYVVNFPIIEDGTGLDDIMNVIDDNDEAVEMFIDKYDPNYITLIAKENLMDYAPQGYIDYNTEILPNLYLSDFIEYGFDSNTGTLIEVEKKHVFSLNNNSLSLQLNNKKTNFINNSNPNFNLYIRNIFTRNISLNVPYRLLDLKIKSLRLNIINSKVVPNVTRNDLNQNQLTQIVNAVYVAICLNIYENLEADLERLTLKKYLKRYYEEENNYINKEYINAVINS
ncbi:ATP-binding protein [Halalkalibacter kiskunsagensis]|uniref:ATP-binding protein n=1 Tax=Halalkalibacter kiskunsagensis TaxID=1548599 RepID=A0ABV6KHQ7_9BACI